MRTPRRIRWHIPAAREIAKSLPGLEAVAVRTFRDVMRDVLMETGIPVVEGVDNARDYAIELLRIAAEAEHALMVQYLYTAASVEKPTVEGTNYHRKFLNIAIEEMGHLTSLQNLLLLLGGRDALHMQRDVMRRASDRNPLPFVLEPLSLAALAKSWPSKCRRWCRTSSARKSTSWSSWQGRMPASNRIASAQSTRSSC